MFRKPGPGLLLVIIALIVLLIGSWRFMLPKSQPTALAPAGKNVRTSDAP